MRSRSLFVAIAICAFCSRGAGADVPESESWALHGQTTFVWQFHPRFTSPYQGPNSLGPGNRGDETFDVTLFAGVRPWDGGELWINPEIDQGFGLSNTLGVAGFVSGEAYKVARPIRIFDCSVSSFGKLSILAVTSRKSIPKPISLAAQTLRTI